MRLASISSKAENDQILKQITESGKLKISQVLEVRRIYQEAGLD